MNPIPTVLIVDDQPDSLRLLYEILQDRGYPVRLADSGALALALLPQIRPDLILLDIRMPGMDGFEVCRQIQADPATAGIPVIFLSSLDSDERLEGFRLGAVDYIQKPFSAEEVLLRVQTHWELRRLRLDLEAQVLQRTQELEAALADKSFLMRELQHRVKNHLTLVNGLLSLTEASDAGADGHALLEAARDRVVCLSQVYDLLYRSDHLKSLDASVYLTRLLEPWVGAPAPGPRVTVRVPAVELPVDTLVPLGLIVNELVTNALKYAFPAGCQGQINLSLEVQGPDWLLKVHDNGQGFQEAACVDEGHGLGLTLVDRLSHQLQGSWSRCSDHGTCVEVRFPTSGTDHPPRG